MKKILIPFIFICFFQLNAQDSQQKIHWEKNRPLSIADFKANPPENLDYEANTNSGISYSWTYATNTGEQVLNYDVKSNFYPNLSWMRDVEEEAYLLAHEQLHFDISELHARKLRKLLSEYVIGRTVRRDLKYLYTTVEKQRIAMQEKFDKETDHSQIKEQEFRWRKYLLKELQRLEAFTH